MDEMGDTNAVELKKTPVDWGKYLIVLTSPMHAEGFIALMSYREASCPDKLPCSS